MDGEIDHFILCQHLSKFFVNVILYLPGTPVFLGIHIPYGIQETVLSVIQLIAQEHSLEYSPI